MPLLQWAVAKWEFDKSQNALEEQFLRSLRRAIPPSIPLIIVADRGFGRTELFRFLDKLGFCFVIGVKGDAYIQCSGYRGLLRQYPLSIGQTVKRTNVLYRQRDPYLLKLALTCARIKKKASTWRLATPLPLTARPIVDSYRRRFWCEENFRDPKQAFGLAAVRVQKAARLENLLLALALVFFILAILRLRADMLGYTDTFAGRKKGQKMISWVTLALNLLAQSTNYLNLLFEANGSGLSLHWV